MRDWRAASSIKVDGKTRGRRGERRRDQGAVILRLDGDSEAFRKHSEPSPQHGTLLQPQTYTDVHTKEKKRWQQPRDCYLNRPPYLLTAASHSLQKRLMCVIWKAGEECVHMFMYEGDVGGGLIVHAKAVGTKLTTASVFTGNIS